MGELPANGKTIEDIEGVLKRVLIHPRIVPAIKSAHASGYHSFKTLPFFYLSSLIWSFSFLSSVSSVRLSNLLIFLFCLSGVIWGLWVMRIYSSLRQFWTILGSGNASQKSTPTQAMLMIMGGSEFSLTMISTHHLTAALSALLTCARYLLVWLCQTKVLRF